MQTIIDGNEYKKMYFRKNIGVTEKKTVSGNNIIVEDGIDSYMSVVGITGASVQETTTGKNLLQNMGTSETKNGVTFTVNDDGSVTVNGTATDTARFMINSYGLGLTLSVGETYVLSGCPSGGGHTSYRLQFYNIDGSSSFAYDLGDGKQFVYTNPGTDYNIVISVGSGVTVSNIVFKPMLRLASISDAEYEPYTNGASPNPDYPQPIVSVGQKLASGKNELNLESLTKTTSNGITYTANRVGGYLESITVDGTFVDGGWSVLWVGTLPLGTYTFDYGNPNITIRLLEGWSVLSKTFTVSDATTTYRLTCNTSDNGVSINNQKIYPMIVKGTSALPYEPYTGGKKASYDVGIDVDVLGKNMLENTATSQTVNGVTFTVNADESITVNGTASADTNYLVKTKTNIESGKNCILNGCPSGGSTSTYYLQYSNYVNKTYNDIGSGIDCIAFGEAEYPDNRVRICIKSGTVCNNLVFYPMIRLASVEDGTYEPYQSQTTHIDRVLHSIGDVKDELTSEGIVRKFGVVELDGSDDEEWVAGTTNVSGLKRFVAPVLGIKRTLDSSSKPLILCTDYIATTPNDNYKPQKGISVASSSDMILVYDENFNTSDISLWKAHLQANPITVLYELAEPTTEPLTTEEQIALGRLKTYDGVTNISVDSGDAVAGMDVEYTSLISAAEYEEYKKVYVDGKLFFSAGNIVTYIVDGKTYTEEVEAGKSCLSPTTFTPTKTDHTFKGWAETEGGQVLTEKVMDSDPITLYAVFQIISSKTVYTATHTTANYSSEITTNVTLRDSNHVTSITNPVMSDYAINKTTTKAATITINKGAFTKAEITYQLFHYNNHENARYNKATLSGTGVSASWSDKQEGGSNWPTAFTTKQTVTLTGNSLTITVNSTSTSSSAGTKAAVCISSIVLKP